MSQPTVHANLTRLPWEQAPDLVTTAEKAHGRVEVRSLKALTVTTPRLVGSVPRWRRRVVVAGPFWSESPA